MTQNKSDSNLITVNGISALFDQWLRSSTELRLISKEQIILQFDDTTHIYGTDADN